MADPLELVGLPEGGPTTLAAVKVQLGIAADDDRDDARLTPLVAAVNGSIRGWAVSAPIVGEDTWPDRIVSGASMLTARLFRRKNSPAGVEAFGAQGTAYVMRNDPDIAMLLRLGAWAGPGVG
jgi:hypothetical protein